MLKLLITLIDGATKEWNKVVILDQNLYDNFTQKIMSDTSKFENFNEDPSLNLEVHYNVFYVSWIIKPFFNENEYGKLYPSGSAPARIYDTHKVHKFSCNDLFSKLRPIRSSMGTLNCNLARFICNLLSPLIPNDYSCKDAFFFLKLRMQIFPENFLFPMM